MVEKAVRFGGGHLRASRPGGVASLLPRFPPGRLVCRGRVMPIEDNPHTSLLGAAGGWITYAQEAVDEVRGWRDAEPARAWKAVHGKSREVKDWARKAFSRFLAETLALVDAIAEHYPTRDPAPLVKVFSAVDAWQQITPDALPALPPQHE